MNDTNGGNIQNSVSFYPGKKQLIPVAFNIAVAPMLLYLFRLWPWPPTVLHMAVFALTSIMAVRYVKYHVQKARMVIDDFGIHCGKSYPADSIRAVKPYMRALKVWVDIDGKEKEKVINLWWVSKEGLQAIFQQASERYGLRE
jgi:hypothetical protein